MALCWAPLGDLFVGPSVRNPKFNFDAQVFRVKYGFDDAFARQLVNEFYDVFRKQRSLCEYAENAAQSEMRTVSSLEFRRVASALLQKFSLHYQAIMRSVANKIKNQNADDFESLQSALIIWSLVDVLLLRSAESLPSSDLCEWAQANSDLLTALNFGENDNIWTKIHVTLCIGNLKNGLELLESCDRLSDPNMAAVREILNKMIATDDSDKAAWYRSQDALKRLLDHNYFAAHRSLEIVAKILIGDQETFDNLTSQHKIKWYEVLVGRTLFCNKFCKVYELSDMIPISVKSMQNYDRLDEILLAVFELDVVQMLKLTSLFFPNWLFVAHLADLLHFAGCTELSIMKEHLDFREFLLFEYANSLITHPSLWQLAVEYFLYCPTYGKAAIKLYVERLAGRTENCTDFKILKLLEICRKCEFSDTAVVICKAKCLAALKSGDVNNALTWCLHTEDSTLAGYVAENFLNFQCQNNRQAGTSLNALYFLSSCLKSSNLMTSPTLVFLSKYSDFLKLKNENDPKATFQLLTDLIVCKLSPRQFWSILLEDLLILLQNPNEESCLSADQVYDLMLFVELVDAEMEILKNSDSFISRDRSKSYFSSLLNDIRLYLVKALSLVAFL